LDIGQVATAKRHVTFESWCEPDDLIAFDFDPDIVGIAVQPFQFKRDGALLPPRVCCTPTRRPMHELM
jgi:hypothetical protein